MLWNPVKELKAIEWEVHSLSAEVQWNPVKELKDIIHKEVGIDRHLNVESGEGIER